MTVAELESVWSTMVPPDSFDGINGRRASGLPNDRPVYLAIDVHHRRHLLIQVPDDTIPITHRDTRSLEVATARFCVGSNAESLYVDLVCIDPAQHATFSAVAADLIQSIRSSHGRLRDGILSGLARWKAFWSARTTSMSREDALGLFGELWFLRRWLGPLSADIISRWQATNSARHDFQWALASVEVKTAAIRTAGEPVHQIVSLEQLADPERGRLFLFSLQVCDDALAANTLLALIEGLVAELDSDFAAVTQLNDKLVARGYSASDREVSVRPLRILAERLYRVDVGFPRITRGTFDTNGPPAGVSEVKYSIDLAACRQFLVATSPTDINLLANV